MSQCPGWVSPSMVRPHLEGAKRAVHFCSCVREGRSGGTGAVALKPWADGMENGTRLTAKQ